MLQDHHHKVSISNAVQLTRDDAVKTAIMLELDISVRFCYRSQYCLFVIFSVILTLLESTELVLFILLNCYVSLWCSCVYRERICLIRPEIPLMSCAPMMPVRCWSFSRYWRWSNRAFTVFSWSSGKTPRRKVILHLPSKKITGIKSLFVFYVVC